MPYGSAAARQPARGGDQSKLATLARLLNPGDASPFRSSYTGDVANDGPGGKPMVPAAARQQLALILAGDTGSTTADDGSGTGSGDSGGGSTVPPAVQDPLGGGGIRGGSGPGGVGNAGGASQPGNAGAAGDAAGHPGGGAFRSATPSDVASRASTGGGTTASGESDRGYLDIGPVGKGLLSAASLVAPMPYSAIPSLLGAAGRAYNVFGPTADIRKSQGLPPTDFWQDVGAIGDLNGYGDIGGDATVANPEQLGERLGQVPAYNLAGAVFDRFGKPAETQKGATYQPGPGGILGFVMRTFGLTEPEARALSPDETDRLLSIKPPDADIAGLWAGADGPGGGSIVPPGGGSNALPAIGSANLAGPAIVSGQDNPAPLGRHALQAMGFTKNQIADGSAAIAAARGMQPGRDNSGGGVGPTGMGGNGFSGNLSAGAGNAVSLGGTGGLQNGFGGGGYERGGFVRGRPDRIVDNHRISADEGEFVVRRRQAQRFAPLLEAINSGSIVPPGGRGQMPAMAF